MDYRSLAASTAVAVLVGGAIPQVGHSSPKAKEYFFQPGTHACTGTLDGSKFPELVPTFFVWDHFWAEKAADVTRGERLPDGALSQSALNEVRQVGAQVRQRTLAERERASPDQLGRDIVPAAVSVLLGRDVLIRKLPRSEYERVHRLVSNTRHELRYTFPVQGRQVQTDNSAMCIVSVNGRDHPELIPESYSWETYFRIRALAASSERTGDTYSSRHVQTIQRSDIPIATQYVIHLLRVATAANDEVNTIRATARQGSLDYDQMQQRLTQVVINARDELIRTLPAGAWEAVTADVVRKHAGTIYDFPTDLTP